MFSSERDTPWIYRPDSSTAVVLSLCDHTPLRYIQYLNKNSIVLQDSDGPSDISEAGLIFATIVSVTF